MDAALPVLTPTDEGSERVLETLPDGVKIKQNDGPPTSVFFNSSAASEVVATEDGQLVFPTTADMDTADDFGAAIAMGSDELPYDDFQDFGEGDSVTGAQSRRTQEQQQQGGMQNGMFVFLFFCFFSEICHQSLFFCCSAPHGRFQERQEKIGLRTALPVLSGAHRSVRCSFVSFFDRVFLIFFFSFYLV